MMKSLVIKLGMLAMTMGVVFWIGWQAPLPSGNKNEQVAETGAVHRPGATLSEPENGAEDPSFGKFIGTMSPVAEKTRYTATTQRGLLDLNRAAAEDLESLPGIGSVLAQRMIAHRRTVGEFQTVEELRKVKGIGSKKFDGIKQLVTVAAPGSKEKVENRPL